MKKKRLRTSLISLVLSAPDCSNRKPKPEPILENA